MDATYWIKLMAQIGGIAALVLICIGVVCIAFAERGEKDQEEDGTPSRGSGDASRPEEAERPAFIPQATIVHVSFWERQERRALTAEELEEGRQTWEAYKARMDAIRKVEQGE